MAILCSSCKYFREDKCEHTLPEAGKRMYCTSYVLSHVGDRSVPVLLVKNKVRRPTIYIEKGGKFWSKLYV